jgi:hypothetical protein
MRGLSERICELVRAVGDIKVRTYDGPEERQTVLDAVVAGQVMLVPYKWHPCQFIDSAGWPRIRTGIELSATGKQTYKKLTKTKPERAA